MARSQLSGSVGAGWVIDATPNAWDTLQQMRAITLQALRDGAIVRYANEIVENTRPRDYPAQISAIKLFGTQYFKFINNPIGEQRIRTPRDMITDIESKGFAWGACDDAAVLLATLGMADALRARFRAVAFGRTTMPDPTAPLSHVITDLHDGQSWCALDVTKPDDMLRPPAIVRTVTLEL